MTETILEIKNLNGKELPTANLKLRQSNEIATFLLFLIVFVAILKYPLALKYWWQLIVGFFVIVFVIMMTVKLVNKKKL